MKRQRIQTLIQIVLAVAIGVFAWDYGIAQVSGFPGADGAGRIMAGRMLYWVGARLHPLVRTAACCIITCAPGAVPLLSGSPLAA